MERALLVRQVELKGEAKMDIGDYFKMDSRELRNSLLSLNETEILALSYKVESLIAVNMKRINESNEAIKRFAMRD